MEAHQVSEDKKEQYRRYLTFGSKLHAHHQHEPPDEHLGAYPPNTADSMKRSGNTSRVYKVLFYPHHLDRMGICIVCSR